MQATAVTSARPIFLRRPARTALLAVAVLGALAVAYATVRHFRAGDAAPRYVTQPVQRGDVAARVTATGTLSPVVQVQVGSQVSGRIKALFADYNSEVKKGQVIATLEPQLFESAVAEAEARLQSARAALTRAEAVSKNASAQHDRATSLVDSGLVAGADVDTALAERRSAEAGVVSARAEVTVARAALEQARVNLAYTTISSPIDGVVVSRSVDVGQTVAASMTAPVLFVLAEDLRKMEVHASVAESDVGRLKPGMKAEFTVDAFPDRTFAGEVKQVRFEAQTVSNVVTYDAIVTVDNASLDLRPGMTANVGFVLDQKKDVLTVASKALRFRPAGVEPPAPRPVAKPAGGAARAPNEGAAPAEGKATPDGAAATDGAPAAASTGDQAAAAPTGDSPRRRRGRGANGDTARGPRTVYLLRDGRPVPVEIVVGLTDGTSTEVVSGDLREGDLVIVGDGGASSTPSQSGGPARRMPRVF